jgi:hypothetical protein
MFVLCRSDACIRRSQSFPDTIEKMEAFWAHYAETQFAFEPQNRALTNAMLKWSKTILPRALGPFFRKMLLSLIDPRIVVACGVKVPFAPMRWAAHITMRQMGRRDPTPDGAPNGTELFAPVCIRMVMRSASWVRICRPHRPSQIRLRNCCGEYFMLRHGGWFETGS